MRRKNLQNLQERRKMYGPQNPDCDLLHGEKYRGDNEDFREAANRWSGFLQDNHEHYMAFREISLMMRFMPAGRIQAGAGSLKNVCLHNCFVMPEFHDSFTDGPTEEEIQEYMDRDQWAPVSIADMGKLAAITMRQGGGVGYDFSTLRPSGDLIAGVQATTDGPLAFAAIFDAYCKATSSAGNRRGAQMMTMRIDHPDIESFIRAKHVVDDSIPWAMRPLRGFNMSVLITDEFMDCMLNDKPFMLRFNGRNYREVNAVALWEMIMRSNYDWAEPGVLFIDTINKMNNLYYCETISATNPCGEQPLPPYGACLLGSLNAVKYLIKSGKRLEAYSDSDGNWERQVDDYQFNWQQLEEDIPHIVRSMDNVIDRARYPLPEQKAESLSKRRIGIGITGLANALEAMGFPYGTPEFIEFQDKLMEFVTNHCYQASALLAEEKGAFPKYDAVKYLSGQFVKTLWSETLTMLHEHGIRNSHLISEAPTGTISFGADNISSGIEPVIAYEQTRKIIIPGGDRIVHVPDYGVTYLGVKGRTVQNGDISAEEHVNVLITTQKHCDSAVSKTINLPTDFPYDKFKDVYITAWRNGAKGCTTYRPNGKYDEPIKAVESTDGDACGLDENGQRTGACAD